MGSDGGDGLALLVGVLILENNLANLPPGIGVGLLIAGNCIGDGGLDTLCTVITMSRS